MNFRTDLAKVEKKLARAKMKLIDQAIVAKTRDSMQVSVKGKNVVVTGSIPGMTRVQVSNFLRTHSCVMYPAVTSMIHFVIKGDTKGAVTTKLQSAAKLNIPVYSFKNISEFNR